MDALLQSARELLGTMSPAQLAAINAGPQSMPAPATWDGNAATAAAVASNELDQRRGQLNNAHQTVSTAVSQANQISRDAHTGLRAIETAWANDKAALAPQANTPEGQAALLNAGQQRVHEATQLIHTAAQRFQGASQQVSATTADLRSSTGADDTHVQPLDSEHAPGWPKPHHPLDLADIKRLPPNQPGPYGHMPIADGVWVPDPSVNQLHPDMVGSTAKYPLDLADLRPLAPGELPRYGEMQLVPGWAVPDPTAPGYSPHPPRLPLDLQDIVKLPSDALGPRGYIRLSVLSDGSAIWVPDPNATH